MELFRGVNIDWLGKKWYFLAFSLIFSVAGVLSLLFWHHLPLDVDFQGGTQVRVRFDHKPDVDRIRQATDRAGLRDARVTSFTASASDSGAGNEVIIALPQRDTKESSLDAGRGAIIKALDTNYSQTAQANAGKLDLDTVGRQALTTYLTARDPQHLGSNPTADQHYEQQAGAFLDYRDTKNGGLVSSIDNLNGIVDPGGGQSVQTGRIPIRLLRPQRRDRRSASRRRAAQPGPACHALFACWDAGLPMVPL